MYTYSCFGQSFYFAMKDGTKIQFGLNYYVLFPAEVSFGLWSISVLPGQPSSQPGADGSETKCMRFFPLEFVHASLQKSVHCVSASNGLCRRWFMFPASAN